MEMNSDYILFDSESKELDEFSVNHLQTNGEVLMSLASASIFSRYYEQFKEYKILVISGSGNNGGDGIVLGTLFFQAGCDTTIFCREGQHSREYEFHKNVAVSGRIVLQSLDHFLDFLKNWKIGKVLVIDALLGTGFRGELRDEFSKIASNIREIQKENRDFRVLNIDVPSGYSIEKDGGIPVDILAEIGVRKWKNLFARLKSKEYSFHPIGFPIKNYLEEKKIQESLFWKTTPVDEILRLCRRENNSNKYKNGSALFVGGSTGMTGAILLSQKMFHALGGGISCITSPSPKSVKKILKKDPSTLVDGIPDTWEDHPFYKKADCMILGPGLSRADSPPESILERKIFTILDAGILDVCTAWKLHELCLLTPHEGELNRIAGRKLYTFEERIRFMRDFSVGMNANLLLKGPIQILCTNEGKVFVRYSPNPRLAIMGSGDLFTGVLGFFYTRTKDIPMTVRYSIQFMELVAEHPKKHPTSFEIYKYLAGKI